MVDLKLLCVSLFVLATLASSFFESAAEPSRAAFLQLTDLLH